MSIAALLRGVEARLRSAAVLNDLPGRPDGKRVGIALAPGKPAPGFGDVWYAVHWGGASGDDPNPQGHDVSHAVTVTITARLAQLPDDRKGRVSAAAGHLFDLAEAIAAPDVIHGNYDVLRFANELIPGTAEQLELAGEDPADATRNGFLEPLVLLGFGPEAERGADWVGAKAADNVFSIPVRFGNARRVQTYEG